MTVYMSYELAEWVHLVFKSGLNIQCDESQGLELSPADIITCSSHKIEKWI